jgi:DNA-binding response OmpR family regulator
MQSLSHIKHALVLEDQYLVADDLEDLLRRSGCDSVFCSGDPSTALNTIFDGLIDLAILDVNLDYECCHKVALTLAAGQVPFIYVTGQHRCTRPELPEAPWVNKPYREEDVLAAILKVCPSGDLMPEESTLANSSSAVRLTGNHVRSQALQGR